MSINVVVKEFLAVGTRHTCPSNKNPIEIPNAIEQLKKRLNEIPNRTGKGLIMFEPTESDEIPTWFVTAEVSELGDIPKDMVVQKIPEQMYATYKHKGSATKFGETYSILHSWILENGDYDHGYMVEQQDDGFDVFSNDFTADVYAPFKPKQSH
ncbi:putative transcriptional regulator YdeE [Paenibacillus baekrokdamisoli]|nr:GyrI-like domain-containing protein [Paenibacillus baekrokdamisoli]MBB3072841.1 putative transcriptional regulator YdeE [Paenibacillus baekrokdamisoli]